jgi:molecular chaperone HscB
MIRLLTNKGVFVRKKGILSATINVNHFDILGVSKIYNIDKINLETNYKNLQKIIIPDNFKTKGKCSEFLSSYVNEAYTTLKGDYQRSLYMLLLEGVEVKEDDKLTNQKHLEEIMEINEKIDETSELMGLKEEVRERIEEIKYDFNEAMENSDLDKAKECCILLSYYMKADDVIFEKINTV